MKKWLYLILFPLLVLITGINYRTDNAVSSRNAAHGLEITTSGQNQSPHAANFGKPNSHKPKHAMRIKAWDSFAAIVFTVDYLPVTKKLYTQKPVYFNNNSPTLSSVFSLHKLRGPPAA